MDGPYGEIWGLLLEFSSVCVGWKPWKVLKFLQAEIESKKITPDQEESLNVASQCLAMAFNTTPEDAKDLPDLLDLLSKACPDSKFHPKLQYSHSISRNG